jgi:peptidyl-prolyl cis-trans isomerase SurA
MELPHQVIHTPQPRARRAAHALVLSMLLAAAAWAQTPPRVVTLDRIVAVINDEVVTRVDLEERVQLAIRQLRAQGTPPPPRDVLERQLLDRMITDRVQLLYARETGLRVDDADLDRALGRIAQDNRMSLQEMRRALEKDGIPFAKFREDIRNEIVIGRLREREVEAKIIIPESEIENFLTTQQVRPGGNDEYNLSHILVVVPENASPEQVQARRARAEQALAQLAKGADFRQVAAAFSDAPDALQGGAMGWRQSSRLPTLFTDAVATMNPGALSPILRSSNGFHILKVNDRRGGSAPVLINQTRARHILIKTGETVSEAEARSRLRTLKERLDNNANFAELARVHSEDASASKGGELGWLSPGDTVPEFERAMNALKPGEVSEPVRSPFGWHLIQVLERRTEDLSRERQRLLARQELRARKSDEAYQEWVRQLRDKAYVELRLEER